MVVLAFVHFRFAGDIVVIAEKKEEAEDIVANMDTTSTMYKMEIGYGKTNNDKQPRWLPTEIKMKHQRLEEV